MSFDNLAVSSPLSAHAERSGQSGIDVLVTHSYHLGYDPKQWEKMQPFPPLGTLYAASLLQANGIRTAVFDSMLRSPEEFEAELLRLRPRAVAIFEDSFNFLSKMCLTRMRDLAFRMAAAARRAGALVIAHGSDAVDRSRLYLDSGVDIVITGQGEWSLLDIARQVQRGEKPHSGIVVGLAGDPMQLPSPDRSLIDIRSYRNAWRRRNGYFMLNLVSSRGCPFQCNWCAKPIFGNHFQARDPRSVAEEMLHLKQTFAPDRLWFADDIFGLDHRWLADFAAHVERLDASVPFKIQARADLLTPVNVKNLKRAGCAEVWMGAESGSQKVLDAMEKGLRVSEIHVARHLLKEASIRAAYFLQFGYPGEDWTDIQRTVALVRDTRPDDIGVSVSYPLPNTRFYERVQQELGSKRNWAHSADLTVMFQGAYSDDFYRAIRNALHAEVDSWTSPRAAASPSIDSLWQKVALMEPLARNRNATVLDHPEGTKPARASDFLPLGQLGLQRGEA